jgi:hypothetical protein
MSPSMTGLKSSSNRAATLQSRTRLSNQLSELHFLDNAKLEGTLRKTFLLACSHASAQNLSPVSARFGSMQISRTGERFKQSSNHCSLSREGRYSCPSCSKHLTNSCPRRHFSVQAGKGLSCCFCSEGESVCKVKSLEVVSKILEVVIGL